MVYGSERIGVRVVCDSCVKRLGAYFLSAKAAKIFSGVTGIS